MPDELHVCHLGEVEYREGVALQERVRTRVPGIAVRTTFITGSQRSRSRIGCGSEIEKTWFGRQHGSLPRSPSITS